jgi:hypothetical protein
MECLYIQEETSALPLIKAYFSATEMEGLVGRIMGKVTLLLFKLSFK